MGLPGIPQFSIPQTGLPGLGAAAAPANPFGGNTGSSLFNSLGGGSGSGMPSFGLPGLGSPASGAASPAGALPGGMPSDITGMMGMLTMMMGSLMTMISALLTGILNGSISGKAPAGSTGAGGSGSLAGAMGGSGGKGLSTNASAGGGGSQETGPVSPGVDGALKRANSMVGMTETKDTAAIQKVTKLNPVATPWCAGFAMNILKDAGVLDTTGCSNINYTPTIQSWAKKNGIWGDKGKYQPKPGDAIEFDWEGDGKVDHIGIVEKVEGGKVYTIEGNSSNSVKKNNYDLGSGDIAGYIISNKEHPGKSA